MLRHGIDGFTSPPEEVVLGIVIALNDPSASAGFEHTNRGSNCKHITTRPQRTTRINQSLQFYEIDFMQLVLPVYDKPRCCVVGVISVFPWRELMPLWLRTCIL
jgi:hypothetical protein